MLPTMTVETTWSVATPRTSGAIAIRHIEGDVEQVLSELTSREDWPIGAIRRAVIPGVDEIIAARISQRVASIMPHGGAQVLRRLVRTLSELGLKEAPPACGWPEGKNDLERHMLDALARACSPLAIDLLLDQPHRNHAVSPTPEDLARSSRLNRLIAPPTVVLAGEPNCGKSTLMNALTRERTSIVHHQPGATRDAVAARVDMAGLVVDLYDLPGFRDTDDQVEQEAIVIGRSLLGAADCVVALAEPGGSWPPLGGEATLRVGTKSDLGVRDDVDCGVCGLTEQGVNALVIAIRDVLVPPSDMAHCGAWWFYSPTAL